MKIFDLGGQEIPQCERGVALGFFDGVHRGHADLVRTLTYTCALMQLEPAVFTFNEHPDTITHKQKRFSGYLTTMQDRIRLLHGLGVGELFWRHFDEEFCRLSPQDFLDQTIDKQLNARLVVVGSDYRFGFGGEGNVAILREWCNQKSIRLEVVPDVELYDDRISSTRIRQLVENGDMKLAASCLGRPFTLTGTVVKGRKIGSAMGFPTANFVLPPEQIHPQYGVYVSRTVVGSRTYPSITNFGRRPTVNNQDQQPVVETYLYDAKIDLYGQTIEVSLLEKIRPEQQFRSLLKLGTQIKEDLDEAYRWHQSCEDAYIWDRIRSIPIWLLQTTRFAQSSIQLVFQRPMDAYHTTAFALLIQVLTASCRRFPGRILLSTELDRLYGSSLDSHIEKHGDLQTLYLMTDALAGWSDGSRPFDEAMQLLFDILLEPQLENDGLFNEIIFDSEKQNMITEWLARENDRPRYAYDRSVQLLCDDQVHGLPANGDLNVLRKLTRQDLAAAYQQLLHETSMMICIGGKITKEQLAILRRNLERMPESPDRPAFASFSPRPLKTKPDAVHLDEFKNIEQARLNLILTGLPPYFSHRGIVANMLNSMLGGDVHSLLFDTVREKMGLAYSVYSTCSRYLSVIMVMAGIDKEKTDEAIKAILEQVECLSAGTFSDRLLETSRELTSGAIKAIHDDLSLMLATVVNSVILGRSLSREDSLSLLAAVGREQIMEMASDLKLNVQYRLLPENRKESEQ